MNDYNAQAERIARKHGAKVWGGYKRTVIEADPETIDNIESELIREHLSFTFSRPERDMIWLK